MTVGVRSRRKKLAVTAFGSIFQNIKGAALSRYFVDNGERAALMMQINVFHLTTEIRNNRNKGTPVQIEWNYTIMHYFHMEPPVFFFVSL